MSSRVGTGRESVAGERSGPGATRPPGEDPAVPATPGPASGVPPGGWGGVGGTRTPAPTRRPPVSASTAASATTAGRTSALGRWPGGDDRHAHRGQHAQRAQDDQTIVAAAGRAATAGFHPTARRRRGRPGRGPGGRRRRGPSRRRRGGRLSGGRCCRWCRRRCRRGRSGRRGRVAGRRLAHRGAVAVSAECEQQNDQKEKKKQERDQNRQPAPPWTPPGSWCDFRHRSAFRSIDCRGEPPRSMNATNIAPELLSSTRPHHSHRLGGVGRSDLRTRRSAGGTQVAAVVRSGSRQSRRRFPRRRRRLPWARAHGRRLRTNGDRSACRGRFS